MNRNATLTSVCFLLILMPFASIRADFLTYDLSWSGAEFGNNAVAVGTITIDSTTLPNPGEDMGNSFDRIVTEFSMTITGASAGNGTFTLDQFTGWEWSTNGGTLNLMEEFFGQPTDNAPWGTVGFGIAGDFGMVSPNAGVPTRSMHFTMRPAGSPDNLRLTNFTFRSIPEPSLIGVLCLSFFGMAARRPRK